MWRASAILILAAGLTVPALAQERRKPKPAEITILSFRAVRSGEQIHIDGRLKNTGEQPARGVLLVFFFQGTQKEPLATLRGEPEPSMLEAGEEAAFSLEVDAPPRAVRVLVEAQERAERDLKTIKGGPHVIE
jgi:hypothetical protein